MPLGAARKSCFFFFVHSPQPEPSLFAKRKEISVKPIPVGLIPASSGRRRWRQGAHVFRSRNWFCIDGVTSIFGWLLSLLTDLSPPPAIDRQKKKRKKLNLVYFCGTDWQTGIWLLGGRLRARRVDSSGGACADSTDTDTSEKKIEGEVHWLESRNDVDALTGDDSKPLLASGNR